MSECKYCEMLSDVELECVIPKMQSMLQDARSPETAITHEQLNERLALKGLYVPKERMGLMISYIRVNSLVAPLVWCPTGFYVSNNNDAIMDQILELRFISGILASEAAALEQLIFRTETTH